MIEFAWTSQITKDHNTIGIPPVTRLLRVIRVSGGWQLWTGTRGDFRVGSYLLVNDDGSAFTITARVDEGDDIMQIRPRDKEVPK